MPWKSGTVTNARPDGALADLVKNDAALLNGGTPPTGIRNWSFVEEVPAGTGAGQSGNAGFSVLVFKCAGSGNDANDAGQDWYVGLSRRASDNTTMDAWVFEDYKSIAAYPADADRGKCRRPLGCHLSSPSAPDVTNYTFDETFRTFEARRATAATGRGYVEMGLNSSGFNYALKLTKNMILLSTYVGTTQQGFFATLIDSAITLTDTLPLVAGGIGTTTAGALKTGNNNYDRWGCFTRLPGVTAANIASAGLGTSSYIWQASFAPWTINGGMGANVAGVNDKWQGGKGHASRIAVFHKSYAGVVNASVTWPSYLGWLRGLVKPDLLALAVASGTVNFLDTVTIGANADWTVVDKAWPTGRNDLNCILVTRAA